MKKIILILIGLFLLNNCSGGGGSSFTGGGGGGSDRSIPASTSSSPSSIQTPEPLRNINYYAILIGINDYPGTIYDLDWARPDAEDLSLVLQNSSNWSGAVIIKLLDSKAAKSDIKNALITAAGRITANGTLFLSYSGHGSNIAGTGYIVPCDGIADNGVYPPNWINSNDLQSYLTAFPSGVKKYVIIDSCYSGLFIDKKSEQVNGKARFIPHPQSGLILKEDFFRTLSSIENLVCIAASTGSELAQESNELQNGVLTYYLVQALGETTLLGPADLNSDKSISSEETYTYAKDLVTDFVRNNFGADKPQHPQIQDNYSGDLEIKR